MGLSGLPGACWGTVFADEPIADWVANQRLPNPAALPTKKCRRVCCCNCNRIADCLKFSFIAGGPLFREAFVEVQEQRCDLVHRYILFDIRSVHVMNTIKLDQFVEFRTPWLTRSHQVKPVSQLLFQMDPAPFMRFAKPAAHSTNVWSLSAINACRGVFDGNRRGVQNSREGASNAANIG